MTVNILMNEMPIARLSRIMDIPRSTIYYRKTGRSGTRKARISENIESEIIRISGERSTYGYSLNASHLPPRYFLQRS